MINKRVKEYRDIRRAPFPRLHPLSQELTLRQYEISSNKIFSPVGLVLVTDLHGISYGKSQEILLEAIRKCSPDIILFAGDIVEAGVSFKGAKSLFTQTASICPCFYSTGNHEFQTGNVPALKRWLPGHGITVLDGKVETVTVQGQHIQVGGVDDPHRFTQSPHAVRLCQGWKEQITACRDSLDPALFSILVTHRPELVKYYQKSGFDLIVAGHAHGGQVRIPGICNGLFAPHQGFFPRYAGGCYKLDSRSGSATLAVSRGLCVNSLPRIFNPPELVSIRVV